MRETVSRQDDSAANKRAVYLYLLPVVCYWILQIKSVNAVKRLTLF